MSTQPEPARDLVGYRNAPPQADWPNEARIAVNFCINYEEGAELCILNGDERPETRISDVVVDARYGARDLNIESSYEYGARVGYRRLLQAFTDRGLAGTVNLVGSDFVTYITDAFDCLYAEGTSVPKMLTIGLHARLLARPARMGALHKIIDHMLDHDKVWACKRGDIAKHWAECHPFET